MTSLPVLQPRSCGACTACCTVMEVPELSKPAGAPCANLCGSGCGVYETRPASCRSYHCLWMGEALPGAPEGYKPLLRNMERPDRLGALFNAVAPEHNALAAAVGEAVAFAYPAREGGLALASEAIDRLARRMLVVEVRPGGGMALRGPSRLVERADAYLTGRAP